MRDMFRHLGWVVGLYLAAWTGVYAVAEKLSFYNYAPYLRVAWTAPTGHVGILQSYALGITAIGVVARIAYLWMTPQD